MKQKVYVCYDSHSLPDVEGHIIFQQRALFDFYHFLDNYTPFFVFIEKDKTIQVSLMGVLIKEKRFLPSFLASRCLIMGKASFFSDEIAEEEAYDLLLAFIDKEFKRKCLFTEFRHFEKDEILLPVFEKYKYNHYPWYDIENNLKKDKISPEKMRQVKLGLKNGASIIEATSEKQVKSFCGILRQLYSKINKPLPPLEFFLYFFHEFCKKGKGVYLLIEFQGRIIGGIMCLFDQKKDTIYEWYIGSRHKTYRNLYPGVLSTYAAIEYGKKNKFKKFDFMGGGQQDKEYGVRDFKLTFGGKLLESSRWRKENFPLLFKLALLYNRLF